jgi:hypothetical protein
MRIVAALALAVLAVSPAALLADTYVYTYTGLDFTDASGPYTTSDSVTGSFTLSSALPDDLTSFTTIAPVSFSFSDGVDTISNTSFDLDGDSFAVETDGSGNITAWSIYLVAGPGGFSGENQINISSSSDQGVNDYHEYSYEETFEEPYYYSCGFFETCEGYDTYYETEDAFASDGVGAVGSGGSWAVADATVAATPEPASLMLVGTALLGGIGFARRRTLSHRSL